jgi:hypothetical protein
MPILDMFTICHLSASLSNIQIVCMPKIHPTAPYIIPPNHRILDTQYNPPSLPSISWSVSPITLELSQSIFHGSPLISDDNSIPCFGAEIVDYEGYEAQISTSFGNWLIQTWWQPEVEVGWPCPHENAYSARPTAH